MSLKVLGMALVTTVAIVVSASPGNADDGVPACSVVSNLYEGHIFCHYSSGQFHVLVSEHTDGVTYSIKPMCVETQDVVDACINQQRCEVPADTFKFMVFRSSPGSPNVPWGTVCLDTDTSSEFDVITPGKVYAEMKKLDWPEAALTIQPPDGKTLVNLLTNFYSDTPAPAPQTITLLGQQVVITASPVRYTWHFGDGSKLTTNGPGATYKEDPSIQVGHTYVDADVTVHAWVDVTYHGSYTVNGGQPEDIPEDLTVTGTRVDLQVLTATPHLVG